MKHQPHLLDLPKETPAVSIYCDGSCFPNPGPGGWGIWIQETGETSCGGHEATTNNRMEMQALIEALRVAPADAPCTIYSDSQLVVNGAMSWRFKWARNGWRKGPDSGAVKNADLWMLIAALMDGKPRARVEWVRGHNGNVGNEKADAIANIGRSQFTHEECNAKQGRVSDPVARVWPAAGSVPGEVVERRPGVGVAPGQGLPDDQPPW